MPQTPEVVKRHPGDDDVLLVGFERGSLDIENAVGETIRQAGGLRCPARHLDGLGRNVNSLRGDTDPVLQEVAFDVSEAAAEAEGEGARLGAVALNQLMVPVPAAEAGEDVAPQDVVYAQPALCPPFDACVEPGGGFAPHLGHAPPRL